MNRIWEYDEVQMLCISGNDILQCGDFGVGTYGLHTEFDGRYAVIRIDAESSEDAIEDANRVLDMIADGRQAANSECSITEAAEELGVSRQRVHAMLKGGQLEGHKVGNTWNVDRRSVAKRKGSR